MTKLSSLISDQARRTLNVLVADRLSRIYKVYPYQTENRLVALNDLTHLLRELGMNDNLEDYK